MQEMCSGDTEIVNVTAVIAQETGTEMMSLIALVEGIGLGSGKGLEIAIQ